jgi:hypothetical protein
MSKLQPVAISDLNQKSRPWNIGIGTVENWNIGPELKLNS